MIRVTLTLGCALALYATAASAELPRRFVLEYRGGASCPSEDEVLAEIQRRAPGAARVADGPHDLRARLSVDTDGEHQRGIVDIESREGSTHREIEAAECAEVVRALALIVAMGIDPDAPAADGSLHRAPEPNPVTAAPPPARLSQLSQQRQAREFWWAAGGGIGMAGGVAPSPSLTETLQFELGGGRDAGWSANGRVSGIHAHGSASERVGSADFELLALRVASCPYRVGTRLALRGCVSFDWGRLQGRGSRTLQARTSSAGWLGPGGFVEAEWQGLPWLRLQLQLGAVLPLARDRFYFGP
ncbi:MAG: hypothetical protein ABJB12_19875, partial [Pseudomonadota bacterium]